MKYVCDVCGWEYDEEKGYPEGGIAPGTKWEDVPEDFVPGAIPPSGYPFLIIFPSTDVTYSSSFMLLLLHSGKFP